MDWRIPLMFLLTFFTMEWVAWALHKYAMHGFLWWLHRDHHTPPKDRFVQLNDFFAFFFAVPSFFSILIGTLHPSPLVGAFGYGVMAYGFAYFLVHEVVIHRRFLLGWKIQENWYVKAVRRAHRDHHQVAHKDGCRNFGMLVVPMPYYLATISQKNR